MQISGRAGDGTCGVGDHSLFLATEIARELDVDLLYREGREPRDEYRETVAERHRLRLLPLSGFGSSSLREILQLVRERRPDIVHLQYPAREYRFSLMPLWLSWMQSQLKPARFVVTLHEYSAANPLRKAMARLLMSCGDATIIPSFADYLHLRRAYSHLQPFYIPNGCFFEQFSEPGRSAPVSREPAILHFGFPSKTKSFSQLVELVKAVRQTTGVGKLKLHLVSGSPWRERDESSLPGSFREGFIQIHPFLPVKELQVLAERCLLTLFPFSFDTHRSSLINALAWATPIACLGYANGVAEEYEGMLPLAPKGDNAASFAQRLGEYAAALVDNFPEASKDQLERQRALRERLSMRAIARSHITVYNQVLAGKKAHQ